MLLAYGTTLLNVAGQTYALRKAPWQIGGLKRVQLEEESTTLAQVHRRHYILPGWGYLDAGPSSKYAGWTVYGDLFGQ